MITIIVIVDVVLQQSNMHIDLIGNLAKFMQMDKVVEYQWMVRQNKMYTIF